MGVEYKHFLLPKRRDFLPSSERIAALVERLRRDGWVMSDRHFELLYRDDDDGDDGAPRYNVDESWLLPRRGEATTSVPASEDPSAFSRPRFELIPAPLTTAWLDARRTAGGRSTAEMQLRFIVDPEQPFDEVGLRFPFTFGIGEDEGGQMSSHELQIHIADDFVAPWSNFLSTASEPSCACGAPLDYDSRARTISEQQRYRRTCPTCGAAFDVTTQSSTLRDGWTSEERDIAGCAYRFALCIDCDKAWPRSREPLVLVPELLALVAEETGEPFEDFGTMS